MNTILRPFAALAAALLLLAGCEETHEPTKPTVVAEAPNA
jgi:predicted component of type VI protein secretion system